VFQKVKQGVRTVKTLKLAVALLAAAVLAGCVYVDGRAGVALSAEKTTVLSGEIVDLDANAWTSDGSSITYAWTEDGVPLGTEGATLSYSRFVTVPTAVTIDVTTRTASGITCTDAQTITVSPPMASSTLVVVNDSPVTVFYLYVSRSGEDSWGLDQMRPSSTMSPGGSFVLAGIPEGTWYVLAVGNGGSPVWTSDPVTFAPGETRTLHLY
jgi:hypothetical protein